MQGFCTQGIGQRYNDDERSFWKSGTFSKIPRFGCGSTDCAIQSSRKELLLAQEGNRVLPALEKEYRTTNCKSDAFILGVG